MNWRSRKVRVFVHQAPTDMRKSFDTLASLVRHELGQELMAGDLFLFVGKDRQRAKVLFFDGTGLCLLCKRLSQGRFANIFASDGRAQMTSAELDLFLDGCSQAGRVELSARALEEKDLYLGPSAFS